MSASDSLFMEAVDVLMLRGNKLFGAAGSFGSSLMPPWPSVAAGALRSRMLVDARVDLSAFAGGAQVPDARLRAVLGTPQVPGSFRIAHFGLARRDALGRVEPLFPLPADVVVSKGANPSDARPVPVRMQLRELPPLLRGSYTLPRVPVLAQATQSKADSGYFLTCGGWVAYLRGEQPKTEHIVHRNQLWHSESRVGVALQEGTGTVRDGALFSTEAVSFKLGAGLCVRVDGADRQLPNDGLLRFGGDGRSVQVCPCGLDFSANAGIGQGQNFTLILTSPGLFDGGWQLPGLIAEGDRWLWRGPGFQAQLVAAAVPRAEIVSGWDLAGLHQPQQGSTPRRWGPKPAQKAAPIGSVYWLENFQGDPDALGKLSETGLWGLPGQNDDASRKAEGFNNVALGHWSK